MTPQRRRARAHGVNCRVSSSASCACCPMAAWCRVSTSARRAVSDASSEACWCSASRPADSASARRFSSAVRAASVSASNAPTRPPLLLPLAQTATSECQSRRACSSAAAVSASCCSAATCWLIAASCCAWTISRRAVSAASSVACCRPAVAARGFGCGQTCLEGPARVDLFDEPAFHAPRTGRARPPGRPPGAAAPVDGRPGLGQPGLERGPGGERLGSNAPNSVSRCCSRSLSAATSERESARACSSARRFSVSCRSSGHIWLIAASSLCLDDLETGGHCRQLRRVLLFGLPARGSLGGSQSFSTSCAR